MASQTDNNNTSSSTNFVSKISLEEYNKQKKEYTEKALLELKSQMATYKPKQNISNASRYEYEEEPEDDDIDDCSSNESSPASVNVIIKTYQDAATAKSDGNSATGLRRRKPTAKSPKSNEENASALSNTIYVQRVLDLQEIQKLKSQLKRLTSALEEEERKNHFLKLDLCNAQVDVSDLKQALETRDSKIKQLETKDNENWWQLIKLKMLIVLLLIIYVYMIVF